MHRYIQVTQGKGSNVSGVGMGWSWWWWQRWLGVVGGGVWLSV